MVFISGPRQVGKTTLARQILKELSPNNQICLNWDRPEHRLIIRHLDWSRQACVVALDEIHKYPKWKPLIKGFFDTEGDKQRLLITGSARLDIYRRGGESLLGRYLHYRLHPLTIGEIAGEGLTPKTDILLSPDKWGRGIGKPGHLEDLLKLGGFPEPLFSGQERAARRWRLARRDLLLNQELRDLTMIRHISLVEQLMELLTRRVGLPISLNNLREDLQVDHKTIAAWIEALKRLYIVFQVRPYSGKLARTLKKEGKIFFWDWSEAPEGGPRFENLAACHFLKLCHWLNDVEGYKTELFYIRDREGREVDFLLVKEGKPWVLAEAKLAGDDRRCAPISYFQQRLNVPHAFQVVARGSVRKNIFPAEKLFFNLP
ncbi:MAG: ATP-binding protein [Elusimicrobia bacterium]|nr:ATP-binding protein [Elusimicrobiota bacterium]